MKKFLALPLLAALLAPSCGDAPQRSSVRTGIDLVYHEILVDEAGMIVPWNSDNPADAYDDILNRVWNFWDTTRADYNGLPYYMNHLAWCADGYIDRGIGGDQIAMAMSSWDLYYMYSGNPRVRENDQFIADYYLAHSMSPSDCLWPDLPFPQNTKIYSGDYDGDMIVGPGYLQPDKAGSFGWELLKLSRCTVREPQKGIFRDAAIKIANTLARNIRRGDENRSPWPFKVNAYTGEVGRLSNETYRADLGRSEYTTNYAPTIELFLGLIEDEEGDTLLYRNTARQVLDWMNEYPVRNGKWGPFFEDVPGWSDTQINAVTYAQFLMAHPEFDPDWRRHVRGILDWVYARLSDDTWQNVGVTAIAEQTYYKVPGNSHTARQACAELQYSALTGDSTYVESAIRQLNWATYMVSDEGMNRYPRDDIWYTDGYGDYVRHYLRAMAANPGLCPVGSHILSSSGGIQRVEYSNGEHYYDVYYAPAKPYGVETIRLKARPLSVTFEVGIAKMDVYEGRREGIPAYWEWRECESGGGVLTVVRRKTGKMEIYGEI